MHKLVELSLLIINISILLPSTSTIDIRSDQFEWKCTTSSLRVGETECSCKFDNRTRSLGAIKFISNSETYLTISCIGSHPAGVSNYRINECNFKIPEVLEFLSISQCPHPDTSYTDIFRVLNIKRVKKLHIFNAAADLRAHHFKNLDSIEELKLVNNNITALPEGIFQHLFNLQVLDLSQNPNQVLPSNIFRFTTKLTELKMHSTNLSSLHGIFHFTPNLEELSIHGSNLDYISKNDLAGLRKLKLLHLRKSKITYLDNGVFDDLDQLENINLDHNDLVYLPKNLFSNTKNLSWISMMNASSAEMTSLPSTLFANLTSAIVIKLEDNRFQKLPKNLFQNCPNLMYISLKNNALRTLPDTIFEDTRNLREIDISGNHFEFIPDTLFASLSELSKVRMTNAYSSAIGFESSALFSNLTSLTEVQMDANHLAEISPHIFRRCFNLTSVSLKNNSLKFLPASVFADTMYLQVLDVSDNYLQFLHDDVFQSLRNLRELKLAGNHLSVVGSNLLQNLVSLKVLDLSRNNLVDFERNTFKGSKSVLSIDLSHNHLTLNQSSTQIHNEQGAQNEDEFRSVFEDCENLEILNLKNNSLKIIYDDWKKNRNLKLLDLSLNDFRTLKPQDFSFAKPCNGSLLVDLSDNKVETIFFNTTQIIIEECQSTNKFRTIFNLKDNPITCNCSALPLLNYLQHANSSVANLKFNHVRCHKPLRLRNAFLEKINPQALTCSLSSTYSTTNENCPKFCSCELRPADQCIIVNCTATGMRTIPPLVPNITEYCVELLFDNNDLTSLNGLSDLLRFNVTKLSLSSNKLRHIDDLVIPDTLKILQLDNNQISSLNHSLVQRLNTSETLSTIQLHNNPWRCDCEHRYFADFLQISYKREKIPNHINVTCREDGKSIIYLPARHLCETLFHQMLPFSYVMAFVTLFIIILISVSTYRVNRMPPFGSLVRPKPSSDELVTFS